MRQKTKQAAEAAAEPAAAPPAPPLPGDRPWPAELARMIRVDHAGEYGAARIYDGQLAIFGSRHPASPVVRHMKEQELAHLKTFDRLVNERRARPSLLTPFWHHAGFALGAATALMGEKAAMACTAAVEEVIDGHYADQAERLGGKDPELKDIVEKFRAEEAEHRETAMAHGAEQTFGYPLLSAAIKTGCKAAIWLAKRV